MHSAQQRARRQLLSRDAALSGRIGHAHGAARSADDEHPLQRRRCHGVIRPGINDSSRQGEDGGALKKRKRPAHWRRPVQIQTIAIISTRAAPVSENVASASSIDGTSALPML